MVTISDRTRKALNVRLYAMDARNHPRSTTFCRRAGSCAQISEVHARLWFTETKLAMRTGVLEVDGLGCRRGASERDWDNERDPRDMFTQDLDLPRGRERRPVRERDRVHGAQPGARVGHPADSRDLCCQATEKEGLGGLTGTGGPLARSTPSRVPWVRSA